MPIYLILDASSRTTQAGIWEDGAWLAFHASKEHALESLFTCVDKCLNDTKLALEDLDAIMYCEGPGSILGIRLVAMAIRTWKALPELKTIPVCAYQSFMFAKKAIAQSHETEDMVIISPSRNHLWNVCTGNSFEEKETEDLTALKDKSIWVMKQRALPDDCPAVAKLFEYDLQPFASIFSDKDLFSERIVIDAINTGDDQFRKWEGERHQ